MNTELALKSRFDWDDAKQLEDIRPLISKTPLTDAEFSYLVQLGKATGLNPFNREIWAVKYKQGDAAQIYIGRDGYRIAASRCPKHLRHQVEAVYSKDEFRVSSGEIIHSFGLGDRGELVSAYCKVYMKGCSGYSYVYVIKEEYGSEKSVWATKPATMLKKVAEAQALRQCFPDFFGGTYSDAEEPEHEKLDNVIEGSVVQGETQTERLNNIIKDSGAFDKDTGEIPPDKGSHELLISESQIDEIDCLMHEKNFDSERTTKAINYVLKQYKVECLEQLTDAQARMFIKQLGRA